MAIPTWPPEKRATFLAAIGKGASMRLACLAAGTSTATPYAWLRLGENEVAGEHREFLTEYRAARATAALAMLDTILAAGRTDWRAAATFLRGRADGWGSRNRTMEKALARKAEAEADRAEAEARRAQAVAERAEKLLRDTVNQTSPARTTNPFLDGRRAMPDEPLRDEAAEPNEGQRKRIAPALRYRNKQAGESLDWPSLDAEGMALKWYEALDTSGRARATDGWHFDVFKRLATAYPVLFENIYQQVVGVRGARHHALLHALEDRLAEDGAIMFLGEAADDERDDDDADCDIDNDADLDDE